MIRNWEAHSHVTSWVSCYCVRTPYFLNIFCSRYCAVLALAFRHQIISGALCNAPCSHSYGSIPKLEWWGRPTCKVVKMLCRMQLDKKQTDNIRPHANLLYNCCFQIKQNLLVVNSEISWSVSTKDTVREISKPNYLLSLATISWDVRRVGPTSARVACRAAIRESVATRCVFSLYLIDICWVP
jgi:hypothetical protein